MKTTHTHLEPQDKQVLANKLAQRDTSVNKDLRKDTQLLNQLKKLYNLKDQLRPDSMFIKTL